MYMLLKIKSNRFSLNILLDASLNNLFHIKLIFSDLFLKATLKSYTSRLETFKFQIFKTCKNSKVLKWELITKTFEQHIRTQLEKSQALLLIRIKNSWRKFVFCFKWFCNHSLFSGCIFLIISENFFLIIFF